MVPTRNPARSQIRPPIYTNAHVLRAMQNFAKAVLRLGVPRLRSKGQSEDAVVGCAALVPLRVVDGVLTLALHKWIGDEACAWVSLRL